MHQKRFQLPTTAAFLAHRELLTSEPTVLNEEDKLNEQIVELASDPNLKRNLAAITFNVDAEIAFQVLLDSEIVAAAESHDTVVLEKLSRTAGLVCALTTSFEVMLAVGETHLLSRRLLTTLLNAG